MTLPPDGTMVRARRLKYAPIPEEEEFDVDTEQDAPESEGWVEGPLFREEITQGKRHYTCYFVGNLLVSEGTIKASTLTHDAGALEEKKEE